MLCVRGGVDVPRVLGSASTHLASGLGGFDLALGNEPVARGVRLNLGDRRVERVDGLNLDLWGPRDNAQAAYRGITIGLLGVEGRTLRGLALGGLGTKAAESIAGVAVGGLGVDSGGMIRGAAVGRRRSPVRAPRRPRRGPGSRSGTPCSRRGS